MNLEQLLKNNDMNTNKAGLIVIADDTTFEFNVEKEHIVYMQDIIDNYIKDGFDIVNEENQTRIDWPNIVTKKYNYVVIRISGEWVLFYIPSVINEYQYSEIIKYKDIINKVNLENNEIPKIDMVVIKENNGISSLDDELSTITINNEHLVR